MNAADPDNAFALPTWIIPFSFAGMAFIFSCLLVAPMAVLNEPEVHRSAAVMLFGQSRFAFSSHLYEMADVYFHRGVGHIKPRAFSDDIFQRLLDDVSPSRVIHMHGNSMQEMMPWLRLATRTDPHNINAYLVTAFIASAELGHWQAAFDILQEAQNNNPFSYEVQFEKARLHLRIGHRNDARHCLDAALAFWPGGHAPSNPDAIEDRVAILRYSALLHESEGETSAALMDLRRILSIHPDWKEIQSRAATLEKGDQPSLLATRTWDDMLKKEDEKRSECHDHDMGSGKDSPDHDHKPDHHD